MSLKPNPVNWFEIPVTDLARGKTFYETAFGITFPDPMKIGPNTFLFFPMERDSAGAGGSLIYGEGVAPSHAGTTVYFSVPAIEPVLESIRKAGGKTLLPRISIGQFGFIAHFEDSEGNRVALHDMGTA